MLYGLYALISVHFLKEEDLQLPVFDANPEVAERVLARMGETTGAVPSGGTLAGHARSSRSRAARAG